jgi:Tol biopolymer transport system component
MHARSLVVSVAALASVLSLGGSTPAVAGCGGFTHQEDVSAAWLPGTDDVVFQRYPQATCGYPSLRYRIPAAGGAPVAVRDGVLSPDGTKVAYTEQGIHAAPLQGGGELRLTSGFDSDPAWSPDGRSIAFTRGSYGVADLYVVALDGSPPRRVSRSANASETRPSFSPDGAWIALIEDRTSSLELIRPDGSGRSLVLARAVGYAWSPDSTRLAVITGPRGRAETAYLVGLDGTVTRLAGTPASVDAATFSPDGSLALVALGKPGTVRVFDPGGQAVAEIAAAPLDLAWSPDARRLAWTSETGITVAAADGSDVHALPGLDARTVAWSPDGTKLAVVAAEPPCTSRPGVFVVDAATLAARQLTNDCQIAGRETT